MSIIKRMTILEHVLTSYPYARLVDESSRTGYQTYSVYAYDQDTKKPEKLSTAPLPDVAWRRAKRIIEERTSVFSKQFGLTLQ